MLQLKSISRPLTTRWCNNDAQHADPCAASTNVFACLKRVATGCHRLLLPCRFTHARARAANSRHAPCSGCNSVIALPVHRPLPVCCRSAHCKQPARWPKLRTDVRRAKSCGLASDLCVAITDVSKRSKRTSACARCFTSAVMHSIAEFIAGLEKCSLHTNIELQLVRYYNSLVQGN